MRHLAALLALAASLGAQTRPAGRCADLRALTSLEVSIAIAADVAESADAPAHCRVFGQILPQVGFEVRMPPEWNGRFVMVGNGGFAGEATDSRGRVAQYGRILRRGYAVAATDTGHSAAAEPGGTFAADRQKLLDYAFRSLHVTAATAKSLLRAYYGVAPAKSYFEGCSTGGRQALILAQRFPEDFDGITVGAPVLNFTSTMVRFTGVFRALHEAPIPASKLLPLAAKIYQKCDALDGIKDGIIDDPRKCDFDPVRDLPRCEAGADRPDCFSEAQAKALRVVYAEVKSQGGVLFPTWPARRPAPAAAAAGIPGPCTTAALPPASSSARASSATSYLPGRIPTTTSSPSTSIRTCPSWRVSTRSWMPPTPT